MTYIGCQCERYTMFNWFNWSRTKRLTKSFIGICRGRRLIDGKKQRDYSWHGENDQSHVPPCLPDKKQKVFHRFLFDLVRAVKFSAAMNVFRVSTETYKRSKRQTSTALNIPTEIIEQLLAIIIAEAHKIVLIIVYLELKHLRCVTAHHRLGYSSVG